MRLIGLVLAFGLLFAPIASQAEQPKTPPRIGFLLMGAPQAGLTSAFDAFRVGLHELGWTENENIVIEYRWAGESPHRLPELAADLVRLKVDIIIASTPGVRAAQQATTSIPIIMCIADDAVKQGFVSNLARPGGNITGMAAFASEFAGKRLQLLREATPRVSRVALLWNPPGSSPDYMKDTEMARIAALGLKHRLPTMTPEPGFAKEGGLVQYGPSVVENWRHAATYVDKILKGAKPADLPVEQAAKFEFVLNMKTAKALGLPIPPSVLLRVDEVVE